MSVLAVARKDFLDTTRTRSLWALAGFFLLVTLVIAYVIGRNPEFAGGEDVGGAQLLFFVTGVMGLFVSIAAIVFCYKSLAGERESGSVKLLLSLPHTRRDVVLGKVLGRGAAIGLPAGLAVLVAGVVSFALAGVVDVVALVVVTLATVAFGVVYAGVMVGVSATTGSTSKAVALAIAVYFVFEIVWSNLLLGLVLVLNGFSFPSQFPWWYALGVQLAPSQAYSSTVVALVPGLADGAATSIQGGQVEETSGLLEAIYSSPEVGIAVLALWLVLPVALGSWAFERADL